jgi:hypothetical protein
MLRRFQHELIGLVAALLLLAPFQGVLCRQACPVCAHAQINKMEVPAWAHCAGMTHAALAGHGMSLTSCCQPSAQMQPAMTADSAQDAPMLATIFASDNAPFSALVAVISAKRPAPPGTAHPRFIALRV